jgi:hypothetical protein
MNTEKKSVEAARPETSSRPRFALRSAVRAGEMGAVSQATYKDMGDYCGYSGSNMGSGYANSRY